MAQRWATDHDPLASLNPDWVPYDSFGARLALIRQTMGWNVKEAGAFCGFNGQNWRNWEAGRSPRQMDRVALRIATTVHCSYEWLMLGGPLAKMAQT